MPLSLWRLAISRVGKKDGIEGADQNRRDRAGARIFRCFPAEKTVKAEAR